MRAPKSDVRVFKIRMPIPDPFSGSKFSGSPSPLSDTVSLWLSSEHSNLMLTTRGRSTCFACFSEFISSSLTSRASLSADWPEMISSAMSVATCSGLSVWRSRADRYKWFQDSLLHWPRLGCGYPRVCRGVSRLIEFAPRLARVHHVRGSLSRPFAAFAAMIVPASGCFWCDDWILCY